MSDVECLGRVQRYPGLFDVCRSLNVAVLNCSTRYIYLRTARWRFDLATHTLSWTVFNGRHWRELASRVVRHQPRAHYLGCVHGYGPGAGVHNS